MTSGPIYVIVTTAPLRKISNFNCLKRRFRCDGVNRPRWYTCGGTCATTEITINLISCVITSSPTNYRVKPLQNGGNRSLLPEVWNIIFLFVPLQVVMMSVSNKPVHPPKKLVIVHRAKSTTVEAQPSGSLKRITGEGEAGTACRLGARQEWFTQILDVGSKDDVTLDQNRRQEVKIALPTSSLKTGFSICCRTLGQCENVTKVLLISQSIESGYSCLARSLFTKLHRSKSTRGWRARHWNHALWRGNRSDSDRMSSVSCTRTQDARLFPIFCWKY